MKVLSLTALSLILCFSLLQASARDSKSGAKITKNEAEHIALKDHHGARVTAAKLETVDGKLVWSIEVAGRTTRQVTHVAVDAMSGRILSEIKKNP